VQQDPTIQYSGRSLWTFQRNVLPPSSRPKSKLSKKTSKQASQLAWLISSTLKLEALCSSETLINFYQNIWHDIPEDSTFHATTISTFFQIHYLWSFCHFSTVNNLYSWYKHIQWSKPVVLNLCETAVQ
jgi:hypothetical protein